jgi:hypothetical protein
MARWRVTRDCDRRVATNQQAPLIEVSIKRGYLHFDPLLPVEREKQTFTDFPERGISRSNFSR